MESKIIVMLVVGILVGGGIGYSISHLTSTPKINRLNTELSNVKSQNEILLAQYATISAQHDSLSGEYGALKTERDDLQSQYTSLSSEYSTVKSDYDLLSRDYEKVSGYLNDLSSDVRIIIGILGYYSNITESFKKVLNSEELEKIGSRVSSVTLESQDNWDAYEKIYKHLVYYVDYLSDIEFPYISDHHHETVDGDDIITGFSVDTTMNYIQTPAFTLEHRHGDDGDQVVTAYAMIKYYERNIYETEYTSYIADIQFSDGSSHSAVFIPVNGGRTRTPRLCILDPAGRYYTNKHGEITHRVVSDEFEVYSKAWSKTAGEITYIRLYDVDVSDGSYTVAASGTLDEIAVFLKTE